MTRRISYSNIAWELADEPAAAEILVQHGIDAVDIAPGKYFPDPRTATQADAQRVRDWWQERGIEIIGMQALLFGVQGLNLFGDTSSRSALLERLTAVARVAGCVGATRLVFGSPKNRDRGLLTDAQALEIAVPFFRLLGERAMEHGVVFCLEPNPTRYACNFMTTTDEAALVVRTINHPGIRLHLDAGTMAINSEAANDLAQRHAAIVGYIHASEPDLAPVNDSSVHRALGAALAIHLPTMPVSIEMRSSGLNTLTQAITAVRKTYNI
jgi:sugar phosphate isomerase/epimerase